MRMLGIPLKWGIGVLIITVFIVIACPGFAQPLRPDLTVVMPMYNDQGPSQMYLGGDFSGGAVPPGFQGIRFSKRIGDLPFDIVSCDCTAPNADCEPASLLRSSPNDPNPLRFACIDKSEVKPGVSYTYQVQAKVNNAWSDSSDSRGNTLVRLWPVTDAGGADSVGLLHGFNQIIRATGTHPYPHEGIDLRGEKAVPEESVRAPLGGRIYDHANPLGLFGYDRGLRLQYYLNGKEYYLSFSHLRYNHNLLTIGHSVVAGQFLGTMAAASTLGPMPPEQQHTHISVYENAPNKSGISKNPLEILGYRDPQWHPPEVTDTNSDNVAVRFRKGPDTASYRPDDGKVYGPVDIVVEAWDHQSIEPSGSPDAQFHPPLRIGYYIQRWVDNRATDVVQSFTTPYLLIDGTKWIGTPYWHGRDVPLNQVQTLVDVTDALQCNIPSRPTWREWFTYIVTNTKSPLPGLLSDLDAYQCWATEARDTETSPNGYRGTSIPGVPGDIIPVYEKARHNQEAKFPDGKYWVRIRLEDYMHEGVNRPEDHSKPVIVDNFLPFIERVTVTSNAGTIYDAGWFFTAGDEQLEWVYDAEPKDPTPGEVLQVQVTTSETMKDVVTVTLTGQTILLTSTDGLIWEGTIVPSASDDYTLTIQGQDMADHPLLAFSETQPAAFPDQIPKPVPKRDTFGDWPAEYDALRQDTSGDTLHRLGKFLSDPFAWSITTPTESLCNYDVEHGGIICTFDEGTGFTLTTLSFQALRDVGVPEAVVDSLHSLQGQRFPTEQALLEAVHAQIGQEQTAQYRSLIVEHAETARGRVTLYPKDFDAIDGNVQYVIFGSVGQNRTTWEGTYQVPTEGSGNLALGVTWEPQEAWFPFREPDPIGQQMWCEDVPDDMPGVDTNGSTPTTRDDKGPPNMGTDTATLVWRIAAEPNPDPAAEICQIHVTWETEDGQVIEEAGTLLIGLQPQRLCETFQDQSEPLEATATYPWEVADRLQYFGCHIVDEQTELLENIRVNTTHKYWPISVYENALTPGQCRSWYKTEEMFRFLPERWPSPPPQDIPFPTSPEEGNIAIQYECQWFEDVDAPVDVLVYTTHWTWTYRCPTVYVEGEGRQTPYLGGYQCNKTITQITWECGDACVYLEEPGEFVLPVPVLERELTLRP